MSGDAVDATKASLWAAGIAAVATIAAVLIGSLGAHLGASRDRRRGAYADALRTVVAWTEMPHRVRRRGRDDDAELTGRFHGLQEDLAYHQGRTGSESKFVERSYIRLVTAAKDATKDLITQAWANPVTDSSSPDPVDPVDISNDIEFFLRDVRAHLSPWPWRKIGLARRNRKSL